MNANEINMQDILDIPNHHNDKFCFVCNVYFRYIGYINKMVDKIYLCNKCCKNTNLPAILKQKGVLTSKKDIEKILIACQFQGIGCKSFLAVKDLFPHKEQCQFKEKASNNYELDIKEDSKQQFIELTKGINPMIPLNEYPSKDQLMPNLKINESKDEKYANTNENAQCNFQESPSENNIVKQINDYSNLNELNSYKPIFEQNNTQFILQEKEIKLMASKIESLEKAINTLNEKEKSIDIEKIKLSLQEIESKYTTEKNDFDKRIEYVLPNYEILLFQMHQLIEEEYQDYFNSQMDKALSAFKNQILDSVRYNLSGFQSIETQIQNTKSIEKVTTNLESQNEIHKNIANKLDENNNKLKNEGLKQNLVKDIKKGTERNDLKEDLISLISQMNATFKEDITGYLDKKLSNLEFKGTKTIKEDDGGITKKILGKNSKEIIQKYDNIQLKNDKLEKSISNLKKKNETITGKIDDINLKNFKFFKIFDGQFRQIFTLLGNNKYNKVINSESFQIKNDAKEMEIKNSNNISTDKLKEIINKELAQINSTFVNLELQNKSIQENNEKIQKRINDINNSLESITTKYQALNKILEGKTDTIIFSDKCDKYDKTNQDIQKIINTININIKVFETFIKTSNEKFNTFEKDILKKDQISNFIAQSITEFQNNSTIIPIDFQNTIKENFCLNCGTLIGCNSKAGCKVSESGESGAILCIKCNAQCTFCNNTFSVKNQTKEGCFKCKRIACPKCKYDKSNELKKMFQGCSLCKNLYCNKCLNFDGNNYYCKKCLAEIIYSSYSKSKLIGLFQVGKFEWNFSDVSLSINDFYNILFLLENSVTVSTIFFSNSSSLKSDQNFYDFMNAIQNHKSLKIATIEISQAIAPRKILKYLEGRVNEILFLKNLFVTVNNFTELQNLEKFADSLQFKWSPLNIYYKIEYGFKKLKHDKMTQICSYSCSLNFFQRQIDTPSK